MSKETTIKKISLQFIYFVNIVCLFFLLMSNLAHFLNPSKWWPVALTGLAFPFLVLAAIAFILFWLFVNKKKTIISVIILLISFPGIKRCFAFHLFSEFTETKKTGDIRVVTWNVGLMNYEVTDTAVAAANNEQIFTSLQNLNPDVLCLQEFFTEVIPGTRYNLIEYTSHRLNLPYYYFSNDRSQFNGTFCSGSIIFSKYKIIDSSKIVFPKSFTGSVIQAGLLLNNDTVNIITTRLQSFHLQSSDYSALHDIKNATSGSSAGSNSSIIYKLKYAYTQKLQQISIVKQLINNSTRPVIFTGDLNDMPPTYTYSNIKNNMEDAWLDNGFGIGRTFRFIAPTLRIDYIFFDDFFQAEGTQRILTTASDHNGLAADF